MIINDSTAGLGCQGKKADEQGRQSTAGERSFSPSIVPRKPRGISRGPQPPGRWGRIPKGTAFGIGSLWRVFAYFLHVEKAGRRRRRDWLQPCRGKRRIRKRPGVLTAAAGTGTGRERFACGRPHFSARRNGERRAGGPFHKGPPDSSSRPRGSAPLDPRRGFYGGRGTEDCPLRRGRELGRG